MCLIGSRRICFGVLGALLLLSANRVEAQAVAVAKSTVRLLIPAAVRSPTPTSVSRKLKPASRAPRSPMPPATIVFPNCWSATINWRSRRKASGITCSPESTACRHQRSAERRNASGRHQFHR